MELPETEKFALKAASRSGAASLVAAVFGVEGERWSFATGFRDVAAGAPATPDTLYCVGSVTKSFTALAVLLASRGGLVGLDDPVSDYVPVRLEAMGEPVRIRHLLTHTSGIPAMSYAEALIRGVTGTGESWAPIADCDDMYAWLRGAAEWAEAKPGERFWYLNEGYFLLGCLLERVTGSRYEEYLRRRILAPLGMRRSYFQRSDVEADGDYSKAYTSSGGAPREARFPWGIYSDGGLWSNLRDLGRYLRAALGAPGAPREIVDALREAGEPRVHAPGRSFGDDRYGYGWLVTDRFHGRRLVHHAGSVGVHTAWVGYLPGEGLAAAVLAGGEAPTTSVGLHALSEALGLDYWELPFASWERRAEELSGRYRSYMGLTDAEVEPGPGGGSLILSYGPQGSRRRVTLFPGSDEGGVVRYYTWGRGGRLEVEFRIRESGITLLYERYKFVKEG